MSVLNADTGAFSLYAGLLKSEFIYQNLYLHMYFILTRGIETLTQINILPYRLICGHSTKTLSVRHPDRQEGLIGKDDLSCPMYSFSSVRVLSEWLPQKNNMSEKSYEKVPWLFVFLGTMLSFSCFGTKIWFRWESVASQGCRHSPSPHLSLHGRHEHASFVLALNLAGLLHIAGLWNATLTGH